MEKFLTLVITLSMVLSFTGCSTKNTNTEYETDITESVEDETNTGGNGTATVTKSDFTETKIFNDEEVKKNLITTTYTWEYASRYYAAIIIKNNSGMDCELNANIVFKDANGQAIGADNKIIFVFEKDTEICFVVNNESEFASFDYNYDVSMPDFYKAATSSLSCEASTVDKKALLTFKNNGEDNIQSVEYVVLFKQGDNVINHGYGFISDFSAGTTNVKEEKSYNNKKDFDNIKVYYYGYKQ